MEQQKQVHSSFTQSTIWPRVLAHQTRTTQRAGTPIRYSHLLQRLLYTSTPILELIWYAVYLKHSRVHRPCFHGPANTTKWIRARYRYIHRLRLSRLSLFSCYLGNRRHKQHSLMPPNCILQYSSRGAMLRYHRFYGTLLLCWPVREPGELLLVLLYSLADTLIVQYIQSPV